MTHETLAAFILSFGAGPNLFAILMRLGPGILAPVALVVVMAAGGALWLQIHGSLIGSLIALWLAWVLAVALVVMALRRRIGAGRARRWVTTLGLLTTTLPWFGLATAQMMAS